MSRESVARAMRERAERLAREAWEGAQTGAEGAYRAGAGVVGAPQGPSGSSRGSYRTTGNYQPGVDPALTRAVEEAAIKNGYRVEAFSGKNARSSGTTHHPGGRATDIRIIDPATGQPLGGDPAPDMKPALFRQYEAFAQDVYDAFAAANPDRVNDFRWGGYFVGGTPMDLMHFDVSGGGMAAGNFKKGLSPQYAKLWGVPGASPVRAGAVSSGDPQVAALQQTLNARGANIAVDGIMGPDTRGALAKYGPQSAYAPTAATTPAQQAAAAQASGTTASGYQRSPQIAAMQRDLNSRGASLTVDGIRGPLTMAAEKNYLGSPTSVRTPSFTNPAYVSRANLGPYYSGSQDEGRGLPRSPYISSTGGANAIQAKTPYTSGRQDEGAGVASPLSMNTRNMRVPTSTIPAYNVAPVGENQTAFNTAPQQWSSLQRPTVPTVRAPLQWSSLQSPYTSSTGGANAIQAPRIPQARPAYPPPSLPAAAGPTVWQQMQERQRLAAAEAAQREAQGRSSQGSRSGGGYSGGGGYTGGSYGGYGGGSITSGVGGAYRNR